jgi:hypothetical protein
MGKRAFIAPQLIEYGQLGELTKGGTTNPGQGDPQGCDNIPNPGVQAKIACCADACFSYGSAS